MDFSAASTLSNFSRKPNCLINGFDGFRSFHREAHIPPSHESRRDGTGFMPPFYAGWKAIL